MNIFKEKKDAPIYATERYPPWLMKMIEPPAPYLDIEADMKFGRRVPTASEFWTIIKNTRRANNQDKNKTINEDTVYESDDNEGEDMSMGKGGDKDDADVDSEVTVKVE